MTVFLNAIIDLRHPEEARSAVSKGERQIKGWRRENKEALIRGDYLALPFLAKRAEIAPAP